MVSMIICSVASASHHSKFKLNATARKKKYSKDSQQSMMLNWSIRTANPREVLSLHCLLMPPSSVGVITKSKTADSGSGSGRRILQNQQFHQQIHSTHVHCRRGHRQKGKQPSANSMDIWRVNQQFHQQIHEQRGHDVCSPNVPVWW